MNTMTMWEVCWPSPQHSVSFPLTHHNMALTHSLGPLAGVTPVYKLSTPHDKAPAPAGALPLHNGQQLDLSGLSLKVSEGCVPSGCGS